MSNSRGFEALTTTTGTSSHYIYFPAELNDRGKTVRRIIVFRKSKVEYANADQTTPEDRERVKCYVKVGTKSRNLIDEARTLDRYLSEEHDVSIIQIKKRAIVCILTFLCSQGIK